MKTLALCLAASVTLPLMGLSSAAFAGNLILRDSIIVSSDTVRLSDIFDGMVTKDDASVFAAPALGATGTIQVPRILIAARDHGLTTIDTGDLLSVTVRRAARKIETDTVRTLVIQALSQREHLPPTIDIALADADRGYFVPSDASAGLEVARVQFDSITGEFDVTIKPLSETGRNAGFSVKGTLGDEIDVPVLSKSVDRSTQLNAADMHLERRDRRSLPNDAILDPADLISVSTRRALPDGTVLRRNDLEQTILVQRGAPVLIVIDMPGITLTAKGKALTGGAMGAAVSVQNLQSKRILDGIVTGNGQVAIQTGAAQVASAEPQP